MTSFISRLKNNPDFLTGLSLQAPIDPAPIQAPHSECDQPRPWVRYWARLIDLRLAQLVGVVLLLALPNSLAMPVLSSQLVALLMALLILIGWIFVEAALLASWGTTPGKWLLRVSVRDAEGRKLTYGAALRRSLDVWCRGMGCGVPVVSFCTLSKSFFTLSDTGVTSWDKRGGTVVTHERIGWLRTAVAIGVLVGSVIWAQI